MSFYRHAFALALLLLAVGCDRTVYEIELTPRGDRIERKLVVSRTGGKSGEEQLAREAKRFASSYPDTFQPDQENKRGFVGTFHERMPADVGGYGTYAHLASPLGSTSLYVERFRGDDDQAARFERLQRALNAFTQLALGWCQQEFAEDPVILGKLRDFIEKDLARDLLNLSLYTCPIGAPATMSATEDRIAGAVLRSDLPAEIADAQTSLYVRLAQYLLERSYFTIGDLPRIVRTLERRDDEEVQLLLAGMIARKIGVPVEHASLKVFADAERLEESWNKYLATTPEFKKPLVDFEQKQEQNPAAEKPEPTAVFKHAPYKEALEEIFRSFGLSVSFDELTVKLHASHQPHATNGQWEEAAKTVLWARRNIGEQFPTICFAFWSLPDGKYQTEHFGKVVLDKEELSKYCLLYRGLTEKETAEWDGFIGKLKPGQELAARLEEFRFSSGTSAEVAAFLRTMILNKPEGTEAEPGRLQRE